MKNYKKTTITRKPKKGTLKSPITIANGEKYLVGTTIITIATSLLLLGSSSIDTLTVKDIVPAPIYDETDISLDTTIKYVANGENVNNLPEGTIFADSEIPTISTAIPTRPGYVFLGWSTDPNAFIGESDYSQGQMYFGKDLTLYAIWGTPEISPMIDDIVIQVVQNEIKSYILEPHSENR